MSPKKVLIFSLSYFPCVGGAEVAVKEITERISLNEIEWDMVTLRFSKSDQKFERIGNVNVYRIGGGLGYLSKILFVPRALIFALKRKYNLYWAMMTYMLFPVVLTKLSGDKTPYVLTLQDGDPVARVFNRWFIIPFRPLLSYGFSGAARVQAISTFLAKWSKREDAIVIPNGVDVDKFAAVKHSVFDKNEIVLVTTSRLVEKNGVGDVIEALKLLPVNVKLKIVGSGPLEENLKSQVRNLKLENRVTFVGTSPYANIPMHLSSADIFVRPSLSEGMGNSFIEAMAAGLPVIATPVGGIPDFLHDEETGLFCEPKNPESIAKAVERLIGDSALREKIVTNAQKLVHEKYDWDLIAKEMKSKVFNL